MRFTFSANASSLPECIFSELLKLSVPIHLSGFWQLCFAIYLFSADPAQSMCDELYPAVAKAVGNYDWRAIEYSMRRAICAAWNRRDPDIWEQYFPGSRKAPSNKQFIATLAMRIK